MLLYCGQTLMARVCMNVCVCITVRQLVGLAMFSAASLFTLRNVGNKTNSFSACSLYCSLSWRPQNRCWSLETFESHCCTIKRFSVPSLNFMCMEVITRAKRLFVFFLFCFLNRSLLNSPRLMCTTNHNWKPFDSESLLKRFRGEITLLSCKELFSLCFTLCVAFSVIYF